MLTLDYSSTIPVLPLPDNARLAVYDSLISRGFQRESMIEQDYAFSDRQGRQIKTNLLAFAHEKFRSPDYTGITVFNPANGILDEQLAQTLAQTAAPFHIIHRYQTQRFSLWFTNVKMDGTSEIVASKVIGDIDYSQLDQVIEAYAIDIQPKRIIDVKQGRDYFRRFEHTGAFQLALWAVDVTGDKLVEHFGLSVESLRQDNVPSGFITDISTQLLGATILAHTGALGSPMRQSDFALDDLVISAHRKFPNYFEPRLFDQWHDAASSAYHILTQLRFANFAPDLLTKLYKEAYPDVAQRRELGRYDTPLYLTRRIWEALPIEYLPPEKRIVADMTCGWGSFLIAGHERLARMIDMEGHPLREHIYGNDKERFTAKLAGLGLLISTLQDKWHISDQDALEWTLPNKQPGIVVGNPPFHGSRKEPSEEHAASKERSERANQFLSRAIDILAPNGYLAMLMPQSFGAAQASPALRKKLLETCDVLEMWELPIGVFPDAQANSLVIFAQKKPKLAISSYPVRVRTVQTRQLELFEKHGPFTASSLVGSQLQWDENSRLSKHSKNTYIFDCRFILPPSNWESIQTRSVELSRTAIAFSGTIKRSPTKSNTEDRGRGSPVKWLKGANNVIRDSFQITYKDIQNLTYPNDFIWPRENRRSILSGEKVLINALANPSWGKRVTAVIERKGVFVSHNFIVLVPNGGNPHITLEVLAAVVDWKVSNAWLLEHLKHTQFPMRAVNSIPFPNLSEYECRNLTNAVQDIEFAWSLGKDQPSNALQTIDDTLSNAYQLDDETYERLSLIANWDAEAPATLDLQFDPIAQWEISGVVDSVDAQKGDITFWLDGFHELQTVPIVPVMPGWLLRLDAAFRTSIPRKCVQNRSLRNNTSWGFFYPQDYSYLSEEEVLLELIETLS